MTARLPFASVSFENATIGYDRHPAVHHVTGKLVSGSLTAIVGPNGAGKSTLLKAAVGLLSPIGGAVVVEGCRRRQIGYLPQQAEIDRTFPLPVFDFIAMGLWRRRGAFASFRRTDDETIASALGSVGLLGFEDRTLDTLSGGQMQRVLFARLILQDAPLVLLDEPFTALDEQTVEDLMAIVHQWHREGRTVAAVLHDLDDVRRWFPQSLLIARHLIAWGPTEETITPANLSTARRMTEAWDDHAPVCDVRESA